MFDITVHHIFVNKWNFFFMFIMCIYIHPFASLDSILNFIHAIPCHYSASILLFVSKSRWGPKKWQKVIIFYFVFIPFSLLGECFLVQVCYFAPKLANILTTSIFYQFNRWFLSSLACGNSSLLWLKGILVGLVLGSWHGCEACNALRMLLKNSVACHIVARYACNIVEQSFLFLFTRLISMATCNY